MEQLLTIIAQYPILILAAVAVAAGIGAGITAFVIIRKQKNNQVQPFVTLDDMEMSQLKQSDTCVAKAPHAGSSGSSIPAIPPEFSSGHRETFGFQEVELKSYQLSLLDLNSGSQYQVNVVDRITIGRKASCVVCIPNKTLSGEHCEIVLNNGKMMLRDMNSTNGTYLNGSASRIREVEIHTGDVIEIGSAKLKVQISVVRL